MSQIGTNGISTITISGAATLSGTWEVIDFGTPPGTRFNILHATGEISGSFDSVNLPNPNWSWGIDGGTTLWVVPEPATLTLLALGGLMLTKRKGR